MGVKKTYVVTFAMRGGKQEFTRTSEHEYRFASKSYSDGMPRIRFHETLAAAERAAGRWGTYKSCDVKHDEPAPAFGVELNHQQVSLMSNYVYDERRGRVRIAEHGFWTREESSWRDERDDGSYPEWMWRYRTWSGGRDESKDYGEGNLTFGEE